MRSLRFCLGLAFVALGATASGCAMAESASESDGSQTSSQTSEITAKPEATAFVLTVQGIESEEVTGGGQDNFCDSECNYAFLGGTSLVIKAIGSAADCFTFSSWDSACAGQGSRCSIVINSNLTITASFKRIQGCRPQ